MRSSITAAIGAFLIATAISHGDTSDIKGFAPVSVSAANYRESEPSELKRALSLENAINPEPSELKPLTEPISFIFLPGEIYSAEPSYEELCTKLTTALRKKGYINAADAQGIIREPDKVKLVLRVSYGQRPWRMPTVRTDRLTWRDGLEARAKGRGLHTLGGERVWDSRAGGNDDALAAAAENQNNTGSAWNKGNASATGNTGGSSGGAAVSPTTGVANVLSGYEGTRDFHLIVVDAFDYAELKEHGKSAKRVWSTFVSAPSERGQRFQDMVSLLIRNAVPFFGETSSGLQVYTDARAEVSIGEAVVVPDETE